MPTSNKTPTALEQELLELINLARLDPNGQIDILIDDIATRQATDPGVTNALRFFDVDLDLFQRQVAEFDPVAPLAWNTALGQSAQTHSNLMIEADTQSHFLPGEPGLLQRMRDAGYENARSVSENVFAFGQSALFTHSGFFIDWGFGPGGMQDPAGHRVAIMNGRFTEIGIAAVAENDPSTSVGPSVVTQHFGTTHAPQTYLLGVVTNDRDNDGLYDAGEGLGGITVTLTNGAGQSLTTQSWSSGGYQVAVTAGTWDVVFTGPGLDGEIRQNVTIGSENVKRDAEASQATAPVVDTDPQPEPDPQPDPQPDPAPEPDTAPQPDPSPENDVLRGDDGAERLLGHGGNDTLVGAGGNDTLDGGTGADIMVGGHGSDVFRVDHSGDRAIERRAWDGHDTVVSSVDFRMGGSHIEDLRLLGDARIGAGNALGNEIRGNNADNILDGGRGVDTLMGGRGDDRYLIRSPGDEAVEAANNGTDTVLAFRAHKLEANIENLFLQTVRTKTGEGVSGVNGVGNALDNLIVGNPFDNVISGRGGRDILKGQGGADTFVFDQPAGRGNVDRIIDFDASEGDQLMLRAQAFEGLSRGDLNPALFHTGRVAADANDRLIFDPNLDRLYYDADGAGGARQQLIATFDGNPTIGADDIFLV